MKNMIIIDANMILRFLLNDNQVQAQEAEQILQKQQVTLLHVVIAEIVYVLEKLYKVNRHEIINQLNLLITRRNVVVQDVDVLQAAFELFTGKNLDFVDCLLCGYASMRGAEIATFDKGILKTLKR